MTGRTTAGGRRPPPVAPQGDGEERRSPGGGDPAAPPAGDAALTRTAVEAAAPETSTGCVVCGFVERAVERRIFFLLAEGMGETWFVLAMRRGGFCLRHARRLVAVGEGPRLTGALRETVAGWLSGGGDGAPGQAGGPVVGTACPVCETETWAEGHAMDLLVDGREDRIRLSLPGREPLCLHHLDLLLAAVPWTRVEEIRGLVAARVSALAALLANPPAATQVLAGGDPEGAVRRSPYRSSPQSPPSPVPDRSHRWEDGTLSPSGLRGELEAGRCPVCSAAVAAARRFLLWLDAAQDQGADRRDLEGLCGPHLFDALELAPRAVPVAVESALGRWSSAVEVLAGLAAPPRDLWARISLVPATYRQARAPGSPRRRPDEALGRAWTWLVAPGALVADVVRRARLRRQRRCSACLAAVTAAARTFDLLDALLAGEVGRRAFLESEGLCLRHAARAPTRLSPVPAATVLDAARSRGLRVRWELDEALRKSVWTVRFEPRGPEALAWRRGLSFLLGEPAVELAGPLTPEPAEPRAAA